MCYCYCTFPHLFSSLPPNSLLLHLFLLLSGAFIVLQLRSNRLAEQRPELALNSLSSPVWLSLNSQSLPNASTCPHRGREGNDGYQRFLVACHPLSHLRGECGGVVSWCHMTHLFLLPLRTLSPFWPNTASDPS